MKESQPGKATPTIIDLAKTPAEKASAKATSSVQTPATPHTDKDNTGEKAIEDPTPKKRDDSHPRLHDEEEVLPENLRRGILALINRSLRIAEDVAAYMRGIEDHEVHGQRLDGDVVRVLTERTKKRKAEGEAEEGRGSKVTKTTC